ncbi:MAG: glycosyltransferase family 39 protein [Isosphaeraceae bacterium]|nr:glycosyltransferase family 39 protein [Isosphaeraceae bacterium]
MSTSSPAPSPFWTIPRLSLAVSLVAGLAVVLTLGGPGVTTDEPLDVRPGRTYIATLRAEGWRFFTPEVVDRVFRDNAEHPPLGRWLLGIASTLAEPFETLAAGPDPLRLYLKSARLAPAVAFAALAGLIAATAGRRYGPTAGWIAGLSLVLMPRVFAHAHLGALDTFITLFWVLALLSAERSLKARRPVLAMALAGLFWGLALLTKIHAWLLIPVVGAWALARLGPRRGSVALLIWAATGLLVFFVGWPWLWYDTLPRLSRYLGTGVERVAIYVQYFGRVYADRDVPWHYPWFYFAATVPVGLHLLGTVGTALAWRERRSDPFGLLLLGSIGLFLVLFSTRVPVYDGERLFLMVFPLWAILVGRGFAWAWGALQKRAQKVVLMAFVLAQGYGVVALHPFGLSYYNVLVGGLPGAEVLGLELTFWGDAVDDVLLDRLAEDAGRGDSAALVPTLYPGQGLMSTTRRLVRREVLLRDEDVALSSRWVVVSRRSAYWKPKWRARLASGLGRRVAVRTRQGVWLSALWEFPIP